MKQIYLKCVGFFFVGQMCGNGKRALFSRVRLMLFLWCVDSWRGVDAVVVLHLLGTEAATTLQWASWRGKTGDDPRASAVHLVSEGHWPVQSAPLPWVRCRHGHRPTFMSQGGRWGGTGSRTLDPLAHCRARAASPAVVCGQHLGVSSASHSPKNRYPPAQEKT